MLHDSPYMGRILMIVSALLTATGQFFWKLGISHLIYMIPGFLCYGAGALFMIKAFSLEKLSVCYPLMCTSYLFALAYGSIFLGETITFQKAIAVVLLGIGVTLTSYDK
ncbi:EamA family transporter [Paenibacillus sp. PAMC21692]|uniref:EamA family transporter n=1 Tax=Paenibacillus sp. PAMC21692 TaxID=2762320 RepID=UPI00164D0D7B|nr:EamA family transporter [Paenibacillus sp. PAMC21692]QNK57598.1 EamA/RhaT family transporter [Paenibacillus sp. PAMC21692]